MQKPKYDKTKPLPLELIEKSTKLDRPWSNGFDGYAYCRICVHSKKLGVRASIHVVNVYHSPEDIFLTHSGYCINDITFASVNYCNATIQVI